MKMILPAFRHTAKAIAVLYCTRLNLDHFLLGIGSAMYGKHICVLGCFAKALAYKYIQDKNSVNIWGISIAFKSLLG